VKAGDLVMRVKGAPLVGGVYARPAIVIDVMLAGNPKHPCALVLYSSGKAYQIAQSLIEVISESR
jgi:hypothetical protein